MEEGTWSAGSLRLVPYTRESLARQENRCRSAEARREEHGFRRERATNLPERECVCIAPDLLPAKIFYTPLEDIGQFGLDKTFCVIAKRSSSYYLYRYSAEDSLFLFSPWSIVRRFAIRISCHRYFELVVMTTILLNCVFLALSQPIEETEYVFLVIYTIEMIIKVIAKGFILNKYSYLRNPWNWLDFIVVLSGYITLCLQAFGMAIGNLSGLRTFRVLRALKTVSITPGLKTIVNAMLHSLGMLAEVMTLTVFCLMVFALLALQLYVGLLRHKCVLNFPYQQNFSHRAYALHVHNKSSWLVDNDGQPAVCGNKTGSRRCPEGYTCLPGIGENPNYGYTNFDSYGWSILTTFQLITLDFWEDVYNKINATTGPTSVFFFMLVVFFGSFYLINLTLAVVAIAYEEEAATTLREQDKIKRLRVSFPSRLYSTLIALKAQTRMFRPTFSRRSRQPQRWCSPRRGAGLPAPARAAPPRIPIPRSDCVSAPRNHFRNRIVIPGETLFEEEEDEEGQQTRSPRRAHSSSLGETPDIVISAGGQLPIVGRVMRNHATRLPKNTVQAFEENLRSPPSDLSLAVTWRSIHCGYFYRRCQSLFRATLRGFMQLRHYLAVIVNDPLFDMMITVCILLNTAFLSIEHYGMSAKTERILKLGNLVFTVIFCLEAVVKVVALGREYFRSNWNLFDLVVVVVSLADLSFETVGGLSVLRTFRLLRVVKLAQAWTTMRLLLTIIASTLGAVGNMTLVLAVIIYIFAILGVQLFSDIYTPENFAPDPVPRWNFTDFWHSLLMMFRILCGEWVQPLWDCMRVSGEKYHVCIVLFLVALTMGNFLVLNLFLAMLLNSFNTQELQKKGEDHEKTSTNSKFWKGFNRIRGVIRRNNVGSEEPFAQSVTPLFQKRRWTEPGISVRQPSPRRVSDLSQRIYDTLQQSRDSPGRLSSFSSTRTVISSNKQTSENRTNSTVDGMETQNNSKDSSPVKGQDDENCVKEPPDCFPTCMYRCIDMEGRPFYKYWMRSRKFVLIVVDHRAFEWTVLVLIFSSSVILCFEDIFLPDKPGLMTVLWYFNLFFTACFVLEVILKWMAYGFVIYFSSLWTTLDFIIVCVSVVSVVAESSSGNGLYALRAFRTLRALRPLRAISRWEGMKIVVNALMSAIPSIFNVLLVCLVFWLIFSIMGVQFFGGKFYRCVDQIGTTLPVQITPDVGQCLTLNYSWINRDINFDNVGNAYLALFQVATFEGWMEVMEYAVDTTEIGHQPYAEANFPAYIYFVTFIICGSFFTLNLFIGVIIDNFNMLKKKYEGGIVEVFLTESQRAYYTAMLKLGRRKPQRIVTRPQNRYLRICYDLSMSRRFEMVVFIFIILNMVAMTVEHYQQPEQVTFILNMLNIVFTALFCTEAVIKIIGLRQYYFTFPWNVFDLVVIIMSVISIIFEEALQHLVISPTLLRVIRLVRIGRILRLIKAAKGIRKLLFALVISLPALFNIGALLFLITFVYAIIGMFLFGHVRLQDSRSGTSGLSEMVNFQTFANSMILLFRLTTSAGWNDILDSLMIQPPDCDPNLGDCGHPTLAIIYLVTYIIINFMVIINMYIAVILENLSQASKEETGISEDDIEMFYVCWSQYDPNATQFIHHSQLSDFVASLDPPLGIEKPNEPALVAMNIPIATGDRIHCLDILHSLVNLVLGDVEDTEEFRTVQRQVDQRFRKSFPTRNLVEIISTTHKRKQQDNAAKVIQRTYKKHRNRLMNNTENES
ncbi:sodium channel protein 60E-like [Argiope bruennichi]|uniref:sodium channel protein 60E-like n=1 Tax=Argiope bruennichi TaxID=94029 RepID=UPI002494D6B0|nr:sodium channel protein 60E-like [Argiope bruennichi]